MFLFNICIVSEYNICSLFFRTFCRKISLATGFGLEFEGGTVENIWRAAYPVTRRFQIKKSGGEEGFVNLDWDAPNLKA